MARNSAQFIIFLIAIVLPIASSAQSTSIPTPVCGENSATLRLTAPIQHDLSLESTLQQRRSTRDFSARPLSLGDVAQILWAAQGISDLDSGKRTAPSSGATYPITLYLSVNNVQNLRPGIYRYQSECHRLQLIKPGIHRRTVFENSQRQPWASTAGAIILFSANPSKVADKYNNYSRDSTLIEAGHISQNIYLQCASLGIGIVAIGGFSRAGMRALLDLPEDEEVIYMNLIGNHKR